MKKTFRRRVWTEQLEPRLMLDAAFSWTQFGDRTGSSLPDSSAPGFGFGAKTILGKNGTAYYATVERTPVGFQEYLIRRVPGDVLEERATCESTSNQCPGPLAAWPAIVPAFEDLRDFDVNNSDTLAALHREPDLEHHDYVISQRKGDSPSKAHYLVVDAGAPSGALHDSPSKPKLGDTAFQFFVTLSDNYFLDASTVNAGVVTLSGASQPRLELASMNWQGRRVVMEFLAHPGDGMWDHTENGDYKLVVNGSVMDMAGNSIQQKELMSFTLDWPEPEPEQPVEQNVVSAVGVSNSPEQIDESIDYINIDALGGSGTLIFDSLRIADNGDIVFSGSRWPAGIGARETVLGLWSSSGSVEVLPVGETLGEFFSIRRGWGADIGANGEVVAEHNGTIYLFESGLNSPVPVIDAGALSGDSDPLGGLFTGIRIANPKLSPDGSTVFVEMVLPPADAVRLGARPDAEGTVHIGVWAIDRASNELHRVVGHYGDAFLDPGEHWEAQSNGTWKDVASELTYPPNLVGATQDASGKQWVGYLQRSEYEDEGEKIRAERFFMRQLQQLDDGTTWLGPPVLLVAHDMSDTKTPVLIGGNADFGTDASGNRFFSVHSGLRLVGEFGKERIIRSFGLGSVPDVDPALMDDKQERHKLLERFAREVAYWDLRHPKSSLQRGTVMDGSYIVGGIHLDPDDPGKFTAADVLPGSRDFPPILAFRGSDDSDDWFVSNIDPGGVGYDQFQANETWVLEWVHDIASQYPTPPIFTGHSLGGALSQWFYTSVVSASRDLQLDELVTFNSPGISQSAVDNARRFTPSSSVTHYIVSGDVVSLAGMAFVDGNAQLVRVRDPVLELLPPDLPRHRRPILLDYILQELPEGQPVEATNQLDIEETVPVAYLARHSPEMAFTSLAYLMDIEWLKEAYRRTRKDGAVGVDGVTAEEYEQDLEGNLQSLLDRAKSGTYKAPPVRRVHIPKGGSILETRPIGIPTLEDKVLQRAVVMLLDPFYEQDFLDCSHGFRRGRSAHDALNSFRDQTMRHWRTGVTVLEIDIRKFFDNLDHSHLRKFLQLRVRDGVLLRLIDKWLKAGVMEDGNVSYPDSGSPQGGVVSPLVSNVFLHYVLDLWFEQEVKPRLKGDAFLVRYADDLVIGFRNHRDAERVKEVIPKRLGKFGLTVHPTKTKLVSFRPPSSRTTDDDRPGTFDLLGFTHYWGVSLKGYWVVKLKTAKDRFTRAVRCIDQWCHDNRHLSLEEQQHTLNQKLRGHYAYYGVTGNSESMNRFQQEVENRWRKWLNRRNNIRSMHWQKFCALLRRYPLAPPRAVRSKLLPNAAKR